jgi:dual specificity phosphatase 12
MSDVGHEVLPRLVLGPIEAATAAALIDARITHVLTAINGFVAPEVSSAAEEEEETAAAEQPGRPPSVVKWAVIDIEDRREADMLSHLPFALDFIQEALGEGDGELPAGAENTSSPNRVLVHCAAGQSRSATIVLAYAMRTRGITFQEAVALIQKERPMISPNQGFTRQLKLFEALGCRLDRTHPDFVKFRIETQLAFVDRQWNMTDGLLSVSKLGKVDAGDSPRRCMQCREPLFNQHLHVAHDCAQNRDCVFVEPLRWMHTDPVSSSGAVNDEDVSIGALSDPSGRLRCHKCSAKLGYFQWKHGNAEKLACPCGYCEFPMFRLQKSALR